MRLLIDLQGMQSYSRDRGIGRYVKALARSIIRNADGHDVRFLLNGLLPDHIHDIIASFAGLATPEQFYIFSVPGPTAWRHVENSWRAEAARILYQKLVTDLEPDVFLIPSLFEGRLDNTIVSTGNKDCPYLVATILYDLIPLLYPDQHTSKSRTRQWYFNKLDEARRSDLLLGISHSACQEGIEFLPSDTDHIRYIGTAAAEEFTAIDVHQIRNSPTSRQVLAYYGITRPFLMHTSAFDARKNFEGLIDAFSMLPADIRAAHQLVLVCKLNPTQQQHVFRRIERAGLDAADVVLTGFVPDDELRVLYGNCTLFVFPSFHEGFGLPVVEAMWCGAPVIGSNRSSIPEVVGLAEALFDPEDTNSIVTVITKGLVDAEFRTRLLNQASVHARTFCWDAVARRAIAAMLDKMESISPAWQTKGGERIDTAGAIAGIASIRTWPDPSDNDLLVVARALEANEQLFWPPSE